MDGIVIVLINFYFLVLMKVYHLSAFVFLSPIYAIVPLLMFSLGLYTFFTGLIGYAISGSENRKLIMSYFVILSIGVIAQSGSASLSLKLKWAIEQGHVEATSEISHELNHYGNDTVITAKWDELQRYYHCCGGQGLLLGYKDYRNTLIGQNFSVPDSCCLEISPGCGAYLFKTSNENIRTKINLHGCLTMLQDQHENDVVPMMIGHTVFGAILALVGFFALILTRLYLIQIKRQDRKTELILTLADMVTQKNDKI